MSDADSPAGSKPGWPGWADERHAWHAGMLLGWLMRHQVATGPVMDDEGNYTDCVDITLDMGPGDPIVIRVKVLPGDFTTPETVTNGVAAGAPDE